MDTLASNGAARDVGLRMAQIQDTSAQDRPIERSRFGRPLLLFSGLLVTALVVSWVLMPRYRRWFDAEASFARERLRFAQVERGTLIRDLSVEGRIVASSYPTLYSRAQGTIELFARAGEPVEEGKLLARITSPELDNRLLQEASNLAALEAELSSQQVTARTTKLRNEQDIELKKLRRDAADRELERAQRSYDEGLVDERELERRRDEAAIARLEFQHAQTVAELEGESLDHGIRTKRSQVESQRLIHEESKRRLDELDILSPVAGVIGTVSVDPRDIVIPNQELLTVIDLSAFEIEISIPETFADDVSPGIEAEITHEGRQYVGMISSVAPEVNNSLVEGRVVFRGEQPTTLRQNQRVSTRIILSAKDDVLKVKRGPFLESGGGRRIYVVDGDMAVATAIVTGARSLTEVEIVSGLELGDTIVISDTSRFEGAETVLLRE